MSADLFPPMDPRAVPAPRSVRRKPGGGLRLWFPRLFILPHVAVGVGVLAYALFLTSTLLFSVTVDGVITGKETGSDDDGTVYRLRYAFRHDGGEYMETERVDETLFRRRNPGDRVVIRIHSLAPGLGARLDGNTEGWSVAMTWVFALFWNTVTGVFLWLLWVLPWLERRLIASGAAAEGVILRKEEKPGRNSTTWAVYFEFTPVVSAAMTTAGPLTGRMNVGKPEYEAAEAGERVVVLYDPRRPGRNVIYKYASYEILPPG